jgi:hypothetical protein
MLVKLPAGSYNVYARCKTGEKHQVVNVSGNGHQRVSLRFSIQECVSHSVDTEGIMRLDSLRTTIAVIGCGALLAACASQQERASAKDDMLSAAGFTILPANTPERRLELQTLPPNKVVQKVQGDKVVFLYADPYACGCLYIGDQAAWNTYRKQQFEANLAREQQMTAQMNEQAAWDWGPWGPGWWRY